MRKPWLLALVSTLLAVALGEGLLRLRYDALPSLAPLESSDLEIRQFDWSDYPPMKENRDTSPTCREQSYLVRRDGVEDVRFGPEGGTPLRLWVAGDSVTMGYGVGRGESFGSLLGARLAASAGVPVVVRNLGINGAGFCAVLRRLNENVGADGAPDVVVLTLFADDLEDRALVGVQKRLVALPDRVESGLGRLLVSHSYLANLAWYAVVAGQQEQVEAHRYIDAQGQVLFKDSVRFMQERLKAQGTALVTVLLAPAGLHLCAPSPPEGSRCQWLGPDMDLMAKLLGELGLPFLDLRRVWEGRETLVIAEELDRMKRGLELGIHPDARGHAVLAEVMWPKVEEALLTRTLP